MNEYIAQISFAVLILVFVIGAFKKNPIQIGILGFAAAFLLGKVSGYKDADIMKFFPTVLFVRLFCILFFFSIPQVCGSIELLAKKMVTKFKCSQRYMPFVLFFTGFILVSCGVQNTACTAILTGVAISIALSMKANPQLFALSAALGNCCGSYSPINEFASNIAFACETAGLTYSPNLVYGLNLIAYGVTFLAVYFFFGGYKVPAENQVVDRNQKLEKFNRRQIISLIGIPVIVALVLILNVDVGWAALIVAIACILLGAAPCTAVLKGVSLNLLILICGIGTLVNIIGELGAFGVLSGLLASVMNSVTMTPLMCLTSSIFSLFTLGRLVILTLVPTLPEMLAKIPNVSSIILISGVSGAALSASVGPLSTTGALIMANLTQMEGEEKGTSYYNKQLLAGVFCAVVFAAVYLVLGLLLGGMIQ